MGLLRISSTPQNVRNRATRVMPLKSQVVPQATAIVPTSDQ